MRHAVLIHTARRRERLPWYGYIPGTIAVGGWETSKDIRHNSAAIARTHARRASEHVRTKAVSDLAVRGDEARDECAVGLENEGGTDPLVLFPIFILLMPVVARRADHDVIAADVHGGT